jgi:predicted nuclease with TOPRIM domain
MDKIDYSKANEFTQKDLMLHLLQVSQHTVTREELKEDILQLDSSLNRKMDQNEKHSDDKFGALDKKIDKVEANLNEKIEALDKKIDKVEANLNEKIDKVDKKIDKLEAKFDKLNWFLIAGALVLLFKEQILKLLGM